MQHLLRGDDLTVGPGARGRFAAWPRWPPCGQAATQQGADAVEGGNCRRAADQAGGDGGAPVGVNREARTRPHAEPATGHLTRRSPGGVGGGTGRRPGACPRRGVAQFANLDKDPMERRAVALAAGRDPGDAGRGPVPRRVAQFANLDKDPMERRAVRSAAGRDPRDASRGPVPRRVAQFANLDKDPMERRAVRSAAGRDAGDASQRPCPGRVAQFANLDKDPMEHRAVGLAAGRDPGDASQRPGPGERRNSRISTKTLRNPARSAWRQGRTPGCQSVTCTRPSGAIRESRQRPYGTSRGGLGVLGRRLHSDGHHRATIAPRLVAMALCAGDSLQPPNLAPARSTPVKSTSVRSAKDRSAPANRAPRRRAPLRST